MADSPKKKLGRAFKALLSDIQSTEGMKTAKLKNLYSFLVQLSVNAQCMGNAVNSKDFDCHDDSEVAFQDISELANVLFRKLEQRFEKLFSKLCGISADKDLHQSLFNAIEALSFQFRCCIFLLPLLEQSLVLEKGLILLRIVRKLSLPNSVENKGKHAFVFEESVFRECSSKDHGWPTSSVESVTASLQFLEPCNPLLLLKTTMLEVFVDELLVNRQLTRYFRIIKSVAGSNERLINPCSAQGDTGILIEAICDHFILSFYDKRAFGDFLGRLFCTHALQLKYPFRASELSVTAAVSLLLNPIVVSAPKYLQAHLISLVSEAVHIKNFKPDRKLTNLFLSAFEKSVSLYMTHMSCLQTDGYSILCGDFTSKFSRDIVYPPFELYVSPETKNKIDTLSTKLDNSSNKDLDDSFFRMKSDLVSSSMRFVKECQSVYAISCQEEILAILSCLVLRASESHDAKAIRPTEGTTRQHLCLLASLLKLMSISLLQAVRCLRHSDDLHSRKTLKDYTVCKEYDFILGAITCFRDLDISLPLQHVLSGMISSHPVRCMDSKMMFFHFSGLMYLSFVSGLECLVKGCLLTISALLNLFVFEEGNLDALKSLVASDQESFSSELPVVRFQETVVGQNSSLVVASKFHKIRSLYSSAIKNKYNEREGLCSQNVVSESDMEAAAWLEEEIEETTNGVIFLKCMLPMEDVTKSDDLIDFVECKQGKDYSSWLKNRQRFRKWRSEKFAVLRWKRKKKSWRTPKGKKN